MIIHNCDQGSAEWYALRAGMPTASDFSKLITSAGETSKSLAGYAITLAAEKYAGKPVDAWQGNGHTDRGKALEPAARAAYALIHDHEVTQAGFVTDDLGRYGCSPDGLVGDDGIAELKCLKAENHIKAIMYYRKYNVCPPDYVQQTQGQLLVCKRQWSDLVFYHPDLPKLVIRQEQDGYFIEALEHHIDMVIVERDRILSEIEAV